jgi:hypothetical protein
MSFRTIRKRLELEHNSQFKFARCPLHLIIGFYLVICLHAREDTFVVGQFQELLGAGRNFGPHFSEFILMLGVSINHSVVFFHAIDRHSSIIYQRL